MAKWCCRTAHGTTRGTTDAGLGGDTLAEAVQVGRAASAAPLPGQAEYGPARRNLANALADLFVETGEPELIEEAVVRAREALPDCAPGEPERPGRLDSLASILIGLGRHTGDEAVLREAVRHAAKAVRIAARTMPDGLLPRQPRPSAP